MYGNLHIFLMQDHYLVAQAQDGAGYPRSCLKKTGKYFICFTIFFWVCLTCVTRAEKTQTLGLLLVWVKLKKPKKPKPKNPAVPSLVIINIQCTMHRSEKNYKFLVYLEYEFYF